MNMILHGIENPVIEARNSLSEDISDEKDRYSLVLANPPFAGSLDYEATAKDLQQIVKTKKTELLFLALFLRLLKVGGRAAVIVPDGVLFGSSTAHKALRRDIGRGPQARGRDLAALGRLPPLCRRLDRHPRLHQDGRGRDGLVWFYDVKADGFSLDDKRQPLLPEDKQGPTPGRTRRGRARKEQSAGRADALGGTERRGTRTGADRAELLRAEGGDRGEGRI